MCLELEKPWPPTEDSVTLGKEIRIINLISCVLLKSVPHHNLQDRWTALKQNKAKPSKNINLILDKRSLYKVLERENSFPQHLCATWESIYLSLTYTTFSIWKFFFPTSSCVLLSSLPFLFPELLLPCSIFSTF